MLNLQSAVFHTNNDNYVGSPYSRTKIYAARVSYAADNAHRCALQQWAHAAPGQTDGRADTAPFLPRNAMHPR